MYTEYDRVRDALNTALREVCLDEAVDVEGPNRLGGFRLNDGLNRVALSFVPSPRNDGLNWWVSAWVEIEDEWTPRMTQEDALLTGRREATLKRPLARADAIIAALQILLEMRVRAAWRTAAAERDGLTEDAPTTPGRVAAPAPPLPFAASTDLVFRTARVRQKTNGRR